MESVESDRNTATEEEKDNLQLSNKKVKIGKGEAGEVPSGMSAYSKSPENQRKPSFKDAFGGHSSEFT